MGRIHTQKKMWVMVGLLCGVSFCTPLPEYVDSLFSFDVWCQYVLVGICLNVAAALVYYLLQPRTKPVEFMGQNGVKKDKEGKPLIDADLLRKQFESLASSEYEPILFFGKPVGNVVAAFLFLCGSSVSLICIFLYLVRSRVWIVIISILCFHRQLHLAYKLLQ